MVASSSIRAAFVFPGQGSQKVGMGLDWAEADAAAREAYAEADEALGEPLSELCWRGPEEDLGLTRNTQPAILATSIAIYRVARRVGVEPVMVAGHSLGEYSALVAAGALGFADALRLVRRRGELMQEAVPVGEGAMAAIIGLEAEEVGEIAGRAAEQQVCVVANYNAPNQTVIAGHRSAVERAVELAKAARALRAMLLPVSAPFHSPLMAPARERLAPLLEAAEFSDPSVPLVTNVDAAPVSSGEAARQALIRQVDGPVRWVDSVRHMVADHGVELFVEIGPGSVLSGLIRRIAPEASQLSITGPNSLAKLEEVAG